MLPLTVSNCGYIGNFGSCWLDEIKEKVPFYQKACCIAYVSNMKDGAHISSIYFIGNCFNHREKRSRLHVFENKRKLF